MKVKTVDISGFRGHQINNKNPFYNKKFTGNDYENTCQRALWAGIKYLSKVDHPDKILDKSSHFSNVYGLLFTPESAKELEKEWEKMNLGWTGLQHECVIGHLQFIAKNGVKKWLDEFKNEKNRIFEIDLDDLKLGDLK